MLQLLILRTLLRHNYLNLSLQAEFKLTSAPNKDKGITLQTRCWLPVYKCQLITRVNQAGLEINQKKTEQNGS